MPPPRRIIVIRHGEKPDATNRGVEADGTPDEKSLSPRGWQRAGALVRFFAPLHPPGYSNLIPSAIFASADAGADDSKRPTQTVTPLAAMMAASGVPFVTRHRKDDVRAAIADAMTRDGVVLMSWEHKRIPALVAVLSPSPETPRHWADDRFDMMWLFDRTQIGWSFSQVPQLLLAGDSDQPIP